jgi:predicted amidophosphoribosyltransferase
MPILAFLRRLHARPRCGNCYQFIDEREECWTKGAPVSRHQEPCEKYGVRR